MAATIRHRPTQARVAALAVVLVAAAIGLSQAGAQEPASRRDGWMPDVAERVEDLRRRTEQDARAEDAADRDEVQWWRSVAAAPVLGRLP